MRRNPDSSANQLGMNDKNQEMPIHASDRTKELGLGCCLAFIPITTLADVVLQEDATAALMAFTCALFVIQQWKHVARHVRRTTAVLCALSALLVPGLSDPWAAVSGGIRIGGLIGSILIAVSLLSRSALRVIRIRSVMNQLFGLPAFQRPLALGIASQFLGGFLGLAGLTAMMEMAAQREKVSIQETLADFSAIARGYAALTLWSPMYSNMSIVLAMYGSVTWPQLLLLSLCISALLLLTGTMLAHFQIHKSNRQNLPRKELLTLLRASCPILVLMLGFMGMMVLLSKSLALPIVAVIIFGAPVVAGLLNLVYASSPKNRWREAFSHLGHDLMTQKSMAGEVILFLASGCAGMVLSQAIPAQWSANIAVIAGDSAYAGILLVMGAVVLISCTSVHPMLSAILVGTSLSPELLNLPAIVHVCALLIGWGLAIIVTPFSVLSVLGARFSGLSIWRISFQANGTFVLIALLIATAVLGQMAAWQHISTY